MHELCMAGTQATPARTGLVHKHMHSSTASHPVSLGMVAVCVALPVPAHNGACCRPLVTCLLLPDARHGYGQGNC